MPLAMFCSRIVLPGARRGDDQSALAEADRGEDVDDAGGQLGRVVLELDHRLGIERGGVVERRFSRYIRRAGGLRWYQLEDGIAARSAADHHARAADADRE